MDKRALIAVGIILLLPIVLVGIWAVQGESMEGSFADALRRGDVHGVHRDLRGKQWSPEELRTISVVKVPGGYGRERAIARSIHSRGRIFVSKKLYAYQGTVRDDATGIIHVFGYRRSNPLHWSWEQIHPDSMDIHLERRMGQLEEMRTSAAEQKRLPLTNQGAFGE